MHTSLKQLVRKFLPRRVLRALLPVWNWYAQRSTIRARRLFERSGETPAWLAPALLPQLRQQYAPPPDYGTDPNSQDRRGDERASELLHLLPDGTRVQSFLELGCADGMVEYFLHERGKQAVGIDITDELFHPKAVQAGIPLSVMDAAALTFEDCSFDCIFSYNTFEHLHDPERVLAEAWRVLKPGGFLYLNFGPLYYSAMGLHAYYQIPIPFCHLLFSPETLRDAVGSLPGASLNRWSLENFRRLWDSYADRLERVSYCERRENYGIELIARYPSCFRSKTANFDNLVVAAIEVLFRKQPV